MSSSPRRIPLNTEGIIGQYRLEDPRSVRRAALKRRVDALCRKRARSKAVHSVKKRLNVLRIYRKDKQPRHCRRITEDMRYLDRIYKVQGTTRQICRATHPREQAPVASRTRRGSRSGAAAGPSSRREEAPVASRTRGASRRA